MVQLRFEIDGAFVVGGGGSWRLVDGGQWCFEVVVTVAYWYMWWAHGASVEVALVIVVGDLVVVAVNSW